MRIAFVHNNCPGQYKHLAPRLAADPDNQVVFFSKPRRPELPRVRKIEWVPRRTPSPSTHRYLRNFEEGVLNGQEVARAAQALKKEGFQPDVVCAHMGWGEALYLKDVWPRAALLGYFEYFYHAFGTDVDFDPGREVGLDDVCRIRTKNALHLLNLSIADQGVTPTRWQWTLHPPEYRDKLTVLHEGIDTTTVGPDPSARLDVDSGLTLSAQDEVVTYVARNLEPYRGFPSFMRALAILLKRRPRCHAVIVGGDGVSYGSRPVDGRSWREHLLEEVDLDRSRAHFLGRVPYERYLKVLQVSRAHVYLSYPFVLSWSMLEAMAAGCLVVGSRTAPVEEVIEDGRNGFLADFFSPEEIAGRIAEALDLHAGRDTLCERARQTVEERYSLAHCLPRHVELVRKLAGSAPSRTRAQAPAAGRKATPR